MALDEGNDHEDSQEDMRALQRVWACVVSHDETQQQILALEDALASLYAQRELDIAGLVGWERWTMQAVADHYGMTKQRVSQVVRKHKAGITCQPYDRRKEAREAAFLAQHAQDLRAENYGMGYREETAAYYGDESVSAADVTEVRINARTLADSLSLAAEHRAYLDSLERSA